MLIEVIDVFAVAAGLGLLAVGLLLLRRRVLARRGGSFDCSLRLSAAAHGKGWALGIASYAGDSLEWYRVFSYSMRPRQSMARRRLQVLDNRAPAGVEVFALLSGAVVVSCRDGDRPVELGMSPESLTGLLSWVESAPPGVQSA